MAAIIVLHGEHAVDGFVEITYSTDCWLGRLHEQD